MVRYTGRARTRTGSVNTNQLGLKMSGCPSTVGKKGRIARYMGRRVDCMMGFCRPVRYHEVLWPRTRMRNQPPFCKRGATRCQAAAGGVGTNQINPSCPINGLLFFVSQILRSKSDQTELCGRVVQARFGVAARCMHSLKCFAVSRCAQNIIQY